MNTILVNIAQWFKSKGGLAHVLAASFAFLMLAYGTVPQFHALVLSIHQSLPGWVQELVTTALALWAFYKSWKGSGQANSSSNATAAQKGVGMVILLAVGMALAGLTGCKTASAPLPAWAPNAQIATVGSVISSANAVVIGYEKDQADCAAQPTLAKCPGVSNPAIHAAVQDIQKALTIAQLEFNSWLGMVKSDPSAPEPADLIAAISTIQTTLAQLPTLTK